MSKLLVGLLLLTGIGLAGCGPGTSRPEMMAPSMAAMSERHASSLSVVATGGCEDCAPGQARLSATQFRDAAMLALRSSSLFAEITHSPLAQHDLALNIFRVDTPMMGFDMRCTIEVGWTLTRPGADRPIWQQAIESRHTATMADAFAGVERVRLCWEGAARNNLTEGIARLARLPLPPR